MIRRMSHQDFGGTFRIVVRRRPRQHRRHGGGAAGGGEIEARSPKLSCRRLLNVAAGVSVAPCSVFGLWLWDITPEKGTWRIGINNNPAGLDVKAAKQMTMELDDYVDKLALERRDGTELAIAQTAL
jgi:hypothetical protein